MTSDRFIWATKHWGVGVGGCMAVAGLILAAPENMNTWQQVERTSQFLGQSYTETTYIRLNESLTSGYRVVGIIEQTLTSANPVIACVQEMLTEKLMGSLHLLPVQLQERVEQELKKNTVLNSVSSSLDSRSVFADFKDEILKQLQKISFPEAVSRLKEIENLFNAYQM